MGSAKKKDSDDRSNRLQRKAERGVFVESEIGTDTIVIVGVGVLTENASRAGVRGEIKWSQRQ